MKAAWVAVALAAAAGEGFDRAADAAALHAMLGLGGPSDDNVYCTDWSSHGECASNPAYMLSSCELSCAVHACVSAIADRELRVLRLLAEQAGRAIDYASLGLGYRHPGERLTYREAAHPSFRQGASVQRSQASLVSLRELCAKFADGTEADATQTLADAFVREIGAGSDHRGTLEGVLSALEAELLMPLRAFNERVSDLLQPGSRVDRSLLPADKVSEVVSTITAHVLDGSFKQWRYSNPVGRRQLEGLADWQIQLWSEASSTQVGPLRVHEDEDNELGFFWATKIGGPSHGFDYEGHCLLPLLANARHKVVLISDPSYPHHPVGRAHFRLLWTAEEMKPLLWLEEIHRDGRAEVDTGPWRKAVLTHVARKGAAMGVMLSCSAEWHHDVSALSQEAGGSVSSRSDRILLRPSNGVVEASDYLSGKHDWVQLEDEIAEPGGRAVYEPPPSAQRREL